MVVGMVVVDRVVVVVLNVVVDLLEVNVLNVVFLGALVHSPYLTTDTDCWLLLIIGVEKVDDS